MSYSRAVKEGSGLNLFNNLKRDFVGLEWLVITLRHANCDRDGVLLVLVRSAATAIEFATRVLP